jgi:hypothetical protein
VSLIFNRTQRYHSFGVEAGSNDREAKNDIGSPFIAFIICG